MRLVLTFRQRWRRALLPPRPARPPVSCCPTLNSFSFAEDWSFLLPWSCTFSLRSASSLAASWWRTRLTVCESCFSVGLVSVVSTEFEQNIRKLGRGGQWFVLICLFQWIQWALFCSLHGDLRCFLVWHTWSETSGWTVSFQPPTPSRAPTASIGRTAVWWAAPSPTRSLTCPQRTAGGATSAWWLQIYAASPGPRWPMRGPSPTPAGFTRTTTLRRTAWPSITVRTFFCPSNTSQNHLNTRFAFIAGLLPICSAISVMAKSAPWLISLLMSLPVAVGLLGPWKRTTATTFMEHRFEGTVSQGLLVDCSGDLNFCQVLFQRSKLKLKKDKILIYEYDTYVNNQFSRKKVICWFYDASIFKEKGFLLHHIAVVNTCHFHTVIKKGSVFNNNNATSHLSYTQNVFWVIKWWVG